MLSKNKIKQLLQYHTKKNRIEQQVFIVEGKKMVEELLQSDFETICIVATDSWLAEHCNLASTAIECLPANTEDLARISFLHTPQEVWALVRCKKNLPLVDTTGIILALDTIQDPGNLGTILRIAEWFGIQQIVCSLQTVDIYNPKVVQASMGAIFRVKTQYLELTHFLSQTSLPIYGADLQGENVYTAPLPSQALIVMGNEGNGISVDIKKLCTHTIHIPTFNTSNNNSESLNVAIATAILCSEFKRRLS